MAWEDESYMWGWGSEGRLGLGDDKNRTIPNEGHFHRVVPRKRVDIDGQDDRTTSGLIKFKFRGDGQERQETAGSILSPNVSCVLVRSWRDGEP